MMPAQTLGVKRRLILDAPGDSEPSSAVMLGVSPAPRGPGRAAYRGGSSRTRRADFHFFVSGCRARM